jgi:hypothetical protein
LNNEKPPDAPTAWDGDRRRTIYVRKEEEELSVVSSESESAKKEVPKFEKSEEVK